MAITVDYTVTPFLITIPQSDLTLESGTRYTLTVDTFWLLLRDFTDNENAMAHPKLYRRIPATSSTPSITEIEEAYYQLQFEDGLYSVNITEGNTNIRDVEVKNQVSVNTNNTAGFIVVDQAVQAQMIEEVWKRLDLDTNLPNRHWQDSSRITNNNDIDLISTPNGDGTFTVQRQ
jgi:hypothetical protein